MVVFNIDDGQEPVERAFSEPPDPFNDLSKLIIPQAYLQDGAVVKRLDTVKVGKPPRQTFFRIRPGSKFCPTCGVFQEQSEKSLSRRYYIVMPNMCAVLGLELQHAQLFLGITRQGNLFIWPVTIPSAGRDENEWTRTSRVAINEGLTQWVKVGADMELGANVVSVAVNQEGEPEWPDLSMGDILRIAFRKEGLIDSFDHPALRKLRGE